MKSILLTKLYFHYVPSKVRGLSDSRGIVSGISTYKKCGIMSSTV